MDIASLIKLATTIPKELKEREKSLKSKKTSTTSNNIINISIYTIVDSSVINSIKRACKNDMSCLRDAARYLGMDLGSSHGVVRLRALHVINVLVIRSNTFRSIIADEIKNIARCAGLLRTDTSSNSSSSNYQKEVEAKVKELIELWDISYGSYYPQIRAMARYLRESLRVDMPNIRERAMQHMNEINERDSSTKRMILLRRNRVMTEVKDSFVDIQSDLDELEGCFSILFPLLRTTNSKSNTTTTTTDTTATKGGKKRTIWECDGEEVENDSDDDSDDDIDWIDGSTHNNNGNDDVDDDDDNNLTASEIGVATHDITITVPMSIKGIENSSNTILLKTMRELYNHMARVTLPKVKEWIAVLEKAVPLYDDVTTTNANTDIISRQPNYEKNKTDDAIDKVRLFLRDAEHLVDVRCKPLFEDS